jgi:DNA-binding NtrC family response regulator
MPALRERREDIPLLATFFKQRYARRLRKRIDRFTDRAQYYLLRYDYPGNVRELENAIERAVTLADRGEITHMDLPSSFREAPVRLLRDGGGAHPTGADSLRGQHDEGGPVARDLPIDTVEEDEGIRTLIYNGT